MRCGLYIRSARPHHVHHVEGGQHDALVRYADDREWTVAGVFVDTGLPGTNLDRPALNALLDRIERRADLDAVLVHDLDRLSRDPDHLIGLYPRLVAGGAEVLSVTQPDAAQLLHTLAALRHAGERRRRRLPVAGHPGGGWEGRR